jgi:Arc/MetJ family transcription regulator
MRTTLDLPEDLLHEAMKATDIKTKTRVIIVALKELIRKHRIAGLKDFKGKVDLDMDLDDIRGRKCR